jgi:hypothetical protein
MINVALSILVPFGAMSFKGLSMPACGSHVGSIIPRGTEKKMLSIDARGIITAMTHKQSFWNLSVNLCPGESMGIVKFLVDSSNSVTRITFASLPFLAVTWHL